MNYDYYNREERYICSHLFRLLHEPMDGYFGLRQFTGRSSALSSFRIFSEVALIRDAYRARLPNVTTMMDDIVRLIMVQESVEDCRLYSRLPEELRDVKKTHPKQIKLKAGDQLTRSEIIVYGAMQGMFNAKPDLVICTESSIAVYEAKYTLGFNQDQLERTEKIAQVWAELLYLDLGFKEKPEVRVLKLGLSRYSPDVSWESVSEIADKIYPVGDRTRLALRNTLGRR